MGTPTTPASRQERPTGMTLGRDRQLSIYSGPPGLPRSIGSDEWEARARAALGAEQFGYVAGSAGAEATARANAEAFYRWRIRPRMLRDVNVRDLSASLFGADLPVPVILAPVGALGIIHQEADRAPARAAAALGVPFTLSTVSSVSIEEIAEFMGDAPRWFQLYPGTDVEVTESMIRRAESAGYSALVVTVDTALLGWRPRDLRTGYLPFLAAQGLANYLSDPVFRSRLARPPEEDPRGAVMQWLATFGNPALSWSDLDRIRSHTRLPLLLKGITHPGDALEAAERGADAVVVSNHGGRQVDGAIAALDALPLVHEAVGDRIPVLMDSGIRSGADVMKALALGASAVLLGRPYVYGMAAAGESGVRDVVSDLLAELDLQLALSGCASVRDLGPSWLTRE